MSEIPYAVFNLRRVAKGLWWMVTPWAIPRRLRQRQVRRCKAAEAEEALAFVERLQARSRPDAPLLLNSDEDAARAARLPFNAIAWPHVTPDAVIDLASAARFCVQLFRSDPAMLDRFPDALSAGSSGPFGVWIAGAGRASLGLAEDAVTHIAHTLDADVAGRARQASLYEEVIHRLLPDGLLPSGQRSLFEWFMRLGRHVHGLSLESVWWLFMQAAQQPREELWQAYLFTPTWQTQFPDGLTRFGRDQFAHWAANAFGLSGAWIDSSQWPCYQPLANEIRTAYLSRPEWRAAQPFGLTSRQGAYELIAWLASPQSRLAAPLRAELAATDWTELSRKLVAPGLNVIGHFSYPSGLRVSVESIVDALRLVEVDVTLRNVRTDSSDDCVHVFFDGQEIHDITLIHTQPEPFFLRSYDLADLAQRHPRPYRIGYWYWEFDSIPDSWVELSNQIDEVWAATEFVATGLRERLSIPVRILFPGVRLAPFPKRKRSHFGLPDDEFTFLFAFHMMSVMERKNPLGLIRAFRTAFNPSEPARLVLKTSFGNRHPHQLQALRDAIGDARITLINSVYSPDMILSLMDSCNAYVSLHRSEGLGLTLAEAMLMGKPVVATGFSGNTDFMNDTNSILVNYDLIAVGEAIPPYDAKSHWANPSIEEAAAAMRRLFEEPLYAEELGRQARKDAMASLSLEAAGRRMADRLEEIRQLQRSK